MPFRTQSLRPPLVVLMLLLTLLLLLLLTRLLLLLQLLGMVAVVLPLVRRLHLTAKQ
jgi:hypothetical protein